jgi:A/G-specific adenine glycosylase
MMLQQTQVKTVIPYFLRWMQTFPNVRSLAEAPVERVLKAWEGLGYYSRARNLHRAAGEIVQKHGGQFPENYEQIRALPGIGPYSAGAIGSIAFNQPTPAVDGNVVRVIARLFKNSKTEGALRAFATERVGEFMVEAQRLERLARDSFPHACGTLTEALMEFGATICLPRNPKCEACPLQTSCLAFKANAVEKYPTPKERPRMLARQFIAVIAESRGKLLVRQRKTGDINAALWELPNAEVTNSTHPFEGAEKLCTIHHSITTSRIQLDVYALRFGSRAESSQKLNGLQNGSEIWASLAELKELPFTGAHRKVLSLFEKSGLRK